MATNATLERGGTTITLPLQETGGTPAVSTDHGKPHLTFHESGVMNPRFADFWSQLETYSITTRLTGSSGYSDAIALADFIKSHSGGDDTTLNIGMPEYDSDMLVAPQAEQEQALTLTYPPGRRDAVNVSLGLTRVSEIVGSGTQDASTPTDSGSGNIQLTDGSTTVDMVPGVTVERVVGRPNSEINRRTGAENPQYIDHRKAAYDAFSIGFRGVSNPNTIVSNVLDLTAGPLGRTPLTLDFNGTFGLGSFDVAPQGSNAIRHVRVVGAQGEVRLPTLNVRVVQ